MITYTSHAHTHAREDNGKRAKRKKTKYIARNLEFYKNICIHSAYGCHVHGSKDNVCTCIFMGCRTGICWPGKITISIVCLLATLVFHRLNRCHHRSPSLLPATRGHVAQFWYGCDLSESVIFICVFRYVCVCVCFCLFCSSFTRTIS